MKRIRVLLVDDVYLAREDLKDILRRRHSDVEIAGEADSTAQAWALVQQDHTIDGVFLDIDIPTESNRSGLDFAANLNRLKNPPWIIFVTGSSQHALEAHRLHPAHYLLKPLDDNTVDQALDWVRKHRQAINATQTKRLTVKHRVQNSEGDFEYCTAFVDAREIVFIQKNNNANSLKIKMINGEMLDGVVGVLKDWDRYGLLQIHKSTLINLDYLRGIKPRPGEDNVYKVYFKSCQDELAVGSTFLEDLRQALAITDD